MARERYLRTLRALAESYHAFERYSAARVRIYGLTPAQFDIIATLGNTAGMNFRELGEKNLITKGTLTGVIDRLEARGMVKRVASKSDGRSTLVRLVRLARAVAASRAKNSVNRQQGSRNNPAGSCVHPTTGRSRLSLPH